MVFGKEGYEKREGAGEIVSKNPHEFSAHRPAEGIEKAGVPVINDVVQSLKEIDILPVQVQHQNRIAEKGNPDAKINQRHQT